MMSLNDKARMLRLPTVTTSEQLEENWRTVVRFGNQVLLAGYYYKPDGRSYFGAVYVHTTEDKTCEGEIRLIAVSEDFYEDEGHALQWAMNVK